MKINRQTADIIGKIIVIILIAVFTASGVISALSSRPGKAAGRPRPKPGAEAQTVTVSVKEIQPETIIRTIKLNGEVSSKTEVNLYPHTGGKIARLLVEDGSRVYKGDIIAYVDPSKPGSAYALSPVTATVSGTVIDSPVHIGDTVTNTTCIATIGSLSDLEIHVNVSEKYSSYLKQGLKARISTVSSPDEVFSASVHAVSPVVNRASRTLDVTLYPDTRIPALKPGMYASAELIIQQQEDTAVIPKTALKEYNNGLIVFCIDGGGTARRVPVRTGLENDTQVQITGGLANGDRVVTAGSVTDGSPVRIAETRIN